MSKNIKIILLILVGICGVFFIFSILLSSKERLNSKSIPPKYFIDCNKYPCHKTVDITIFPTPQLTEQLDANSLQNYHSNEYPFGFEYLSGSQLSIDGGEGTGITGNMIYHEGLETIYIEVQDNPTNLTPRQWFENKKSDYDAELITEMGEKFIKGSSVFVVGQAETCRTGAMIVAFVSHGNKIYEITQSGNMEIDRKKVIGMDILLSTLVFDDAPGIKLSVPQEWTVFPQAKEDLLCSN